MDNLDRAQPKTDARVRLTGKDGNAFNILALTRQAMRKAGVDQVVIDAYVNEATSGDYDMLLTVTMQYVHVS